MTLLLDTHILLWWYHEPDRLTPKYRERLASLEKGSEPVSVSVISFWEIAKLVQVGKFEASFPIDQWFEDIEDHPLIRLFPITRSIILESTRLGSGFPRDPGDQLIVATARVHNLSLMTMDSGIINSRVVTIA